MLPEELTALPLELEKMFYELQDRIMTDVVRRLNKTGEITSTADYQLNKYKILGGTTEMIESEIKRLSGRSDAQIWEIYDRVVEADYTRHKSLYEQINGEFLQFDDPENEILQSWVSGIVAQTQNGVKNICKSLGFAVDMGGGRKEFFPLAEYYQKYLDSACLDIVTGSFSYEQVLKKTVKQMAASGLQTVDYATGHRNRAPVAVRRAVLTGVHQVSNQINESVAKQLKTDYFEVTAHMGARPSHMTWQGKVYKHSELVSICGLGEVTGLCGANCRHSYYAFFPGISVRAYSDEELERMIAEDGKKKMWQGEEYGGYERTQKQRQYETVMRAQRAQIKALKLGDAEKQTVEAAQAKYLETMREYKAFSKYMGLEPQLERVYVDGLGRMAGGRIPQKAFFENSLKTRGKQNDHSVKWVRVRSKEYNERLEKALGNKTVADAAATYARRILKARDGMDSEELYAISLTTGKRIASITDQFTKQRVTRTKRFTDDVNRALAKGDKVLYLHNHPNSAPPSVGDLNELAMETGSLGIAVGHNGDLYLYKAPKKLITNFDINVASRKTKIYNNDMDIYANMSKDIAVEVTKI